MGSRHDMASHDIPRRRIYPPSPSPPSHSAAHSPTPERGRLAHTAAPAGLVQIHKVDFDLIDVALLVLADVVGDAASRWLLAVFVAKLHVQILLHMESILRIQSLPHKKDRDEQTETER